MSDQPCHLPTAANIVDVAPLLLALREVRGLSAPVDLQTDAHAEALAVLATVATGRPGVLRRRAAEALWRLGIAPRPLAACGRPADVVGACVAACVSCARCEFNRTGQGLQEGTGRW